MEKSPVTNQESRFSHGPSKYPFFGREIQFFGFISR